jgi:hypothetical protein
LVKMASSLHDRKIEKDRHYWHDKRIYWTEKDRHYLLG